MIFFITKPSIVKAQVIELTDGEYYSLKMLGKYSITNATTAAQKLLDISAVNARALVDTLIAMP